MPLPEWVAYLIRLGYEWPRDQRTCHRLALVSLPCDSAAAGLISLGRLIRDLGDAYANDLDGHHDSLLRYAHQYLKACRTCDDRCNPKTTRCGYSSESNGILRTVSRPRLRYFVSDKTDVTGRSLVLEQRDTLSYPPRGKEAEFARHFFPDGGARPELPNAEGQLPSGPYCSLVNGAIVHAPNLKRSYAGTCLAGRSTGEHASREVCEEIRLRTPAGEHSVADLLTVREWSVLAGVSRLSFLNTRSESRGSWEYPPSVIIADGHGAFLKCLSRSEFQRSDVIGVIQRTADRADLESVGEMLAQKRQWFDEDASTAANAGIPPVGVSIAVLSRRVGR